MLQRKQGGVGRVGSKRVKFVSIKLVVNCFGLLNARTKIFIVVMVQLLLMQLTN